MPERILKIKSALSEKRSHTEYFKIAISVDCVIFGFEDNQLKVLAIKSDLKEFHNQWSLLGDLIKPNEDIETAAYRILKERTGMDDVYLEQVYAFGDIERHPSGRVITIAYYSLIDIKSHRLKLTDNNLSWHKISAMKKMAFDHKKILDKCLVKLRSDVLEKPVIFNLLQEKFTLRDLQNLYQAILDTNLDRRNFRKSIANKGWIEDTKEIELNVPHRPGNLYRLKTACCKGKM